MPAGPRLEQLNIEKNLAAGKRTIGRKIGLTSPAVQKQLGVGHPDYGTLLSDMIIGDGLSLRDGEIIQPRAEAEIAFILGRDIETPHPNVSDVLRATEYLAPAIEIVGSRIANWDIRLLDTVADNASSGRLVLGSPARKPDGMDLNSAAMEMGIAGEVKSTGTGRARLGSPLNAVAWLAGVMSLLGAPLRQAKSFCPAHWARWFPWRNRETSSPRSRVSAGRDFLSSGETTCL